MDAIDGHAVLRNAVTFRDRVDNPFVFLEFGTASKSLGRVILEVRQLKCSWLRMRVEAGKKGRCTLTRGARTAASRHLSHGRGELSVTVHRYFAMFASSFK